MVPIARAAIRASKCSPDQASRAVRTGASDSAHRGGAVFNRVQAPQDRGRPHAEDDVDDRRDRAWVEGSVPGYRLAASPIERPTVLKSRVTSSRSAARAPSQTVARTGAIPVSICNLLVLIQYRQSSWIKTSESAAGRGRGYLEVRNQHLD